MYVKFTLSLNRMFPRTVASVCNLQSSPTLAEVVGPVLSQSLPNGPLLSKIHIESPKGKNSPTNRTYFFSSITIHPHYYQQQSSINRESPLCFRVKKQLICLVMISVRLM